LNQYK